MKSTGKIMDSKPKMLTKYDDFVKEAYYSNFDPNDEPDMDDDWGFDRNAQSFEMFITEYIDGALGMEGDDLFDDESPADWGGIHHWKLGNGVCLSIGESGEDEIYLTTEIEYDEDAHNAHINAIDNGEESKHTDEDFDPRKIIDTARNMEELKQMIIDAKELVKELGEQQ